MDKLKIGNITLKNKIIQAPLAGYTNQAYRKIIKMQGCGLVFTEMVSAKGLVYDNDKTKEYIITNDYEKPVAVQIFGEDIADLVYATKYICKRNYADIIDINMGCPVKKVIKQNAGAYLLKDVDKIYKIVKSVVEVSSVPVSVKIRAGYDASSINCVEVSKAIEKAGALLITIHGRTRSDMYGGSVNLDYIKMVKESVKIPVIGNGDIKSIEDAVRMFEYTKCDGIMIGRGALGNPWLIRDLIDFFDNKNVTSKITLKERIEMIKFHYQELKKLKGAHLALLEIRSLALWYLKTVKNSKNIKLQIVKIGDEDSLYKLLDSLLWN